MNFIFVVFVRMKGFQKSVRVNESLAGGHQDRGNVPETALITTVIGISAIGLVTGTVLGIFVVNQITKREASSGSPDAISNYSTPSHSEKSFRVLPQNVAVVSV